MNNWIYSPTGRPILSVEDLPNHENVVGFIYKITNVKTGKFYIGKKSLFHSRKTKITKKEKAITKSRKVFKRVVKESDWATYYGSCAELSLEIQDNGPQHFKREILELCCNKKYLNYCELSYQIKLDVLTANSYNGNILGRYYKKDMSNCKPTKNT